MRGWFSGPGVGVLDTRYLRLDASNDPVTAGLEVNAATAGEPVLILQTTDDDATNPVLALQNSGGVRIGKITTDDISNIFMGVNAGVNNAVGGGVTGQFNLFVGYNAGGANTSGYSNVAMGGSALFTNTTGYSNFALGFGALYSNVDGYYNVAIGDQALNACTSGFENVAIGRTALELLTTAERNVAVGMLALGAAIPLQNNTAVGHNALRLQTGGEATAVGYAAMFNNTAWQNTAIGSYAAYNNTSGTGQLAIGYSASFFNATGINNTILGHEAGRGTGAHNKSNNVMVGYRAGYLTMAADENILIGYQAGNVITTGDANIIIGYDIDPTGAAVNSELNIGALLYGDLANNMGGVNVTPPSLAAAWHVDQATDDAAIPVLLLNQADVSEEMIEFVSTIGVGNAIEAVGGKVLTTTHFIKVTLPGGLTRYIPAGTIA